MEKHYRPEAIVISVAGNVTHEGVLREMERLWGDLPRSDPQVVLQTMEQLSRA